MRKIFAPIALLALVSLLTFWSGGRADAGAPAGAAESTLFGDADCSDAVDLLDALDMMAEETGISRPPCDAVVDVQCDADVDAGDAIEIVRQKAGLGASTPGCPDVGTSLAGEQPAPTTINVSLNDDLHVTKTVGLEGGEVVATGADGTTFTLSIPAGALGSDEDVTLTPADSITGLPLSGGLMGAVVIGPEELMFVAPVTLTITPSAAPSGQETIGFGFDGDEFFLYPMLDESDPAGVSAQGALIRLPYIGPGGYGVGSGTGADREGQQEHPPTGPEDQLAQSLDDIFSRHDHSSAEFDAELTAALEQYYRSGLLAVLQFAPSDCDLTHALLVPYVKWLGLIQAFIGPALVPGDKFYEERTIMENGLAQGVANCFEESYRRCVDVPDPSEAFWLFRYLGIAQSGMVGGGPVDLLGDFQGKIDECLPEPCNGEPECKWVGSATAEVRYFPISQQDRTFSVTVNNLVFDLDEGYNGAGRYESYILVEAGPITWEASGSSGTCALSGTMTLDPPGSDGDFTSTSDGEMTGAMLVDVVADTYLVVVSGQRADADLIICGQASGGWPGISSVWTSPFATAFKNGVTTLALGEYHDPSANYGGMWTWNLRQVK